METTIKKVDVNLWTSGKACSNGKDLAKKGLEQGFLSVQFEGLRLDFVPTKDSRALKAEKSSPGFAAFKAVPYGTEIVFITE